MSEETNTGTQPSKEAVEARQAIRKLMTGVVVVSDRRTLWRAVDQEIQAAIDKVSIARVKKALDDGLRASRAASGPKDYFPFTPKNWPT